MILDFHQSIFYASYIYFNLLSHMMHFHIHSAYYLVILHSFRNLCVD
ncbi:hypothetical protein E2C01_042223 [Portunus trituberculatus]|uniref:Uncharacterized protein n=1 Tax=Portunus trituberculatus TaxID=210409 RepID=A0A5B7FL79_PORTR|nr:hypothetical protein [Portunus trituberculatus]